MSLYIVDVESDGAIPGDYSMVCFGAVKVEPNLPNTFYRTTKPISDKYNPEALAISGFSREEHLTFNDPKQSMLDFAEWINQTNTNGRPIFMSDNNGYDWMFICWYFHHFTGSNPFGFSSRRIGDLYCGMKMSMRAGWKHLRGTTHDHNPVNDAKGNAEALLKMFDMGLKL
jgi:hypothetical protein